MTALPGARGLGTLGLGSLGSALREVPVRTRSGRVVKLVGTLLEAELPGARVGEVCHVEGGGPAETVGFRGHNALLMPFGSTDGIRYGARVDTVGDMPTVSVGDGLRGRVLDGFGEPIDGKGPLGPTTRRALHAAPPDPLRRTVIRQPLETGVRVLDGLLTLGRGQRVGLMAGSGVGKSTLLGMIARRSAADVNVIALIGERGREVREFIEDVLGPEGLARSVVVVVTSDKSPVLQVRGAFVAATIADYLRDEGDDVMFFMDSVTRLAMAQRQIGLATGEPPTTKGYTPSVFGLLPRLLERAGPGVDGSGSITALYAVLVDGDDMQDPIGDAVRGIVDGHVVLSRRIASQGQFPAVDVLQSLSRVMPNVTTRQHLDAAIKMRRLLATWSENEELVRLGVYRAGASPEVDQAIARIEPIRAFLRQRTDEASGLGPALAGMEAVVGVK
ncbi:MAG: FliI/YscN family ATPase [Pseudomonadota bacterium]|nr:FliI/YscN family ATPase [Pseudomonadota bacterium]